MSTSDTNVAQILRDIAAESDAVSGKIIKKAHKAAAKGKCSVVVAVSLEDWQCVAWTIKQTPPIERLLSLGFEMEKVSYRDIDFSFWKGEHQIRVRW